MEALTTAECIHIYENSQLQSRTFTPDALTATYVAGLAALQEKQEREWPTPLDLEELVEMDGQPVWVEFGCGESGWAILEVTTLIGDVALHGPTIWEPDIDFLNMEHNDPDGHHGLHLLGWRVYRNKPPGKEGPAQEGGGTP